MGVTGLWGILEPAGKPTRIQSLRGKVLAVDVSIWLHQAVKGFRDRDGNPIRNAHLLGVFHRVCKLLSNGIRPVFVFDGGVPALKKQTMSGRRKRKIEAMDKSTASRKKLIQNLLREQLQRQYLTELPPAAEIDAEVDRILKLAQTSDTNNGLEPKRSKSKSSSPKKKISSSDTNFDDDFEKFREKLAENFNNFSIFLNELDDLSESPSESEDEKKQTAAAATVRGYDENFDAILSPTFDELPLDVQHEMLYEMQESRKNNSWGKMDQMPKNLQSFSSFQMERLRKRRTVQKKIQSVQKEMGQRHIHLTNFDDLAAFNYEDMPASSDVKDVRVAKTRDTGMIYVKSSTPVEAKEDQAKAGTSKKSQFLDVIEGWSSDEEDLTEEQQLQKAIELSLQHEKQQEVDGESEAVKAAAIFARSLAEEAESKQSDEQIEETAIEEPSGIQALVDIIGSDSEPPNTFEEDSEFEDLGRNEEPEVLEEVSMDNETEPAEGSKDVIVVSSSDEDEFEEVEPDQDIEPAGSVESTRKDDTDVPLKKEEVPLLTIEINKDEKFTVEDDIFADIFEAKQEGMNGEDAVPNEGEVATQKDEEAIIEEMDSDSDFEKVEMPEVDEKEEPKEEKTIERTLGSDPTKPVKMISAKYMQAQEQLNKEKKELKSAAGFQERIATSITDQMYTEAQELLSLFGVPYIVSPMEAESQCAFLDTACLTEGTITDDSDVWLFGGQRVYKNFFSQGDRPLNLFEYADVVQNLNLDRDKLILIAILTGSDYTDGVEGVGPVKALEILSEFPSKTFSAFDSLITFREWWEEAQNNKKLDADNKIRSKLRNIKLRSGFPNKAVWDAYMFPTIDESLEPFRWGTPDLDALRGYTKSRFGWNQQKADAALLPLIKTLTCQPEEHGRRQITLDSFLQIGKLERNLEIHGGKRKQKSKRLQQAMKKLKGRTGSEVKLSSSSECESDEDSPVQQAEKSKKGRRDQTKNTVPKNSVSKAIEPSEVEPAMPEQQSEEDKELDELLVKMGVRKMTVRRQAGPSSTRNGCAVVKLPRAKLISQQSSSNSSSSASSPITIPEPVVRSPIQITPKKPEIIPQKAREEFQKQLNKKKAVELLKMKKKK